MMRSLRAQKLSLRAIADRLGVSHQKVYLDLGGQRTRRMQAPANDNRAERTTRMSAWNGGCSTTSGLVPVTLKRIPTLECHGDTQVAA